MLPPAQLHKAGRARTGQDAAGEPVPGGALGNESLEKSDKPRATDFTTVTMEFDGEDLIVRGDGTEIFRFSAQSGRPVRLRPEDAKAADANPAITTYMNDKRFTGVKDYGPIPEGAYTFRVPRSSVSTSASSSNWNSAASSA